MIVVWKVYPLQAADHCVEINLNKVSKLRIVTSVGYLNESKCIIPRVRIERKHLLQGPCTNGSHVKKNAP